MYQIFIFLICIYLTLGCASKEELEQVAKLKGVPGPTGSSGLIGVQGPTGSTGAQGPTGEAGSSCTVYKSGKYLYIACGDGSLQQIQIHGKDD